MEHFIHRVNLYSTPALELLITLLRAIIYPWSFYYSLASYYDDALSYSVDHGFKIIQ